MTRTPFDYFGAVPDDVRAIVLATHEKLVLRGWLKLAGTRSAAETTAAIKAYPAEALHEHR